MTARSTSEAPGREQYGWARASHSRASVVRGVDEGRLSRLMAEAPARGLLIRGGGRSYGDAALNAGGLLLTLAPDARPEIDPKTSTVTVAASTTFGALMEATVPHGLLPAVLPGTRHLTVGGALAADVHGKNHRRDGSISGWVDGFDLMTPDGRTRSVRHEDDPALFRATIGGMGLTGVILRATLRTIPITSTRLRTVTVREPDLDGVLATMEAAQGRYAVAWVDGTATGVHLGRGVVDVSDHESGGPEPLTYRQPAAPRIPPIPFRPVSRAVAAAFDTAWFRAAPRRRETSVSLSAFFHRLDALSGWNRGLGPQGFLQYQFVVPLGTEAVLRQALEAMGRHGAACFLGTLKRFGPGNEHPLSFPLEGWCLALDIALPSADTAAATGLATALDDLDHLVAQVGGRVYLAKDGRLAPSVFARMYPRTDEWQATRARVDPDGILQSDLGRRLRVVPVIDVHGRPRRMLLLGGTSEIGLEIVRALPLAPDAEVVLAGRDLDRLREVAGGLGVRTSVREYDAAAYRDHDGVLDDVFATGDVDLVVAAAGVLVPQDDLDQHPERAGDLITTNYTGPVVTLLGAARRLSRQGFGTLVVLSSVAGVRPRRTNYVYGSAKSGLDAFSRGLAYSLDGSGVRVILVRPGFVVGRMTQGMAPAPLSSTPADVAEAVVGAYRTRRPQPLQVVWVPRALRVLAGGMRLTPTPVWKRLPR